ncbi:hypothetical protein ACFQJ7_09420 [Halovenus rubra]|uniref:Uncharacterized protein n=2 Tax=Halovenus rubra TaxID=869890 RepID=A0ACC7DWX0_9EURY|nr:hypothetical protein [Halovenus rubra]
MSSLVNGIAAAVITCFGIGLPASIYFYKGYRLRQWYQRIDTSTRETPDTVRPGETALVRAPIATGRDTNAPISGDDTALAAWDIREWSNNSSGWIHKMRGVRLEDARLQGDTIAVTLPTVHTNENADSVAHSLGLDDTTGQGISTEDVLIETGGFDTDIEYNPRDSLPEHLVEFENHIGLDPAEKHSVIDIRRHDGARNYRETAIDAGETVTVFGRVTAADTPGGPPSLVPPEDGHLLVTGLSPEKLARRYQWGYRKAIYGVGSVTLLMSTLVGYAVYL